MDPLQSPDFHVEVKDGAVIAYFRNEHGGVHMRFFYNVPGLPGAPVRYASPGFKVAEPADVENKQMGDGGSDTSTKRAFDYPEPPAPTLSRFPSPTLESSAVDAANRQILEEYCSMSTHSDSIYSSSFASTESIEVNSSPRKIPVPEGFTATPTEIQHELGQVLPATVTVHPEFAYRLRCEMKDADPNKCCDHTSHNSFGPGQGIMDLSDLETEKASSESSSEAEDPIFDKGDIDVNSDIETAPTEIADNESIGSGRGSIDFEGNSVRAARYSYQPELDLVHFVDPSNRVIAEALLLIQRDHAKRNNLFNTGYRGGSPFTYEPDVQDGESSPFIHGAAPQDRESSPVTYGPGPQDRESSPFTYESSLPYLEEPLTEEQIRNWSRAPTPVFEFAEEPEPEAAAVEEVTPVQSPNKRKHYKPYSRENRPVTRAYARMYQASFHRL